jgi:hypothetical protein
MESGTRNKSRTTAQRQERCTRRPSRLRAPTSSDANLCVFAPLREPHSPSPRSK